MKGSAGTLICDSDSQLLSIELVIGDLNLDRVTLNGLLDGGGNATGEREDSNLHSIWIPREPKLISVLMVGVDLGWSCDGGVNGDVGGEGTLALWIGLLSIEFHRLDGTLSSLHVGSSEGLNLGGVDGAVWAVEALGLLSSRGGQILVGLELPVSPSNKVFVGLLRNLVDLSSAHIRVEASSEFRDEKWHSEALGVGSSLVKSILMPLGAGGS